MALIGIVEPDSGVRNLMKLVLTDEGHRPLEIDLAQAPPEVDLLIVDASNHCRDDLIQLSTDLRNVYQGIPVLFCTSFPDLARIAEELKLFEDVLLKPFSLDELLARVANLLSTAHRLARG